MLKRLFKAFSRGIESFVNAELSDSDEDCSTTQVAPDSQPEVRSKRCPRNITSHSREETGSDGNTDDYVPWSCVVPRHPGNGTLYMCVSCLEEVVINGEITPVVVGSCNEETMRVAVPSDSSVPPHMGDHLVMRLSPLVNGNIFTADHFAFTRTQCDVLVRITNVFRLINGKKFVFFDKNICCEDLKVPEEGSRKMGTVYKVSVVESKQPKYNLWRAWKVEIPTLAERENIAEVVCDGEIDFGDIVFGSSLTKSISVKNQDPDQIHILTRVGVYGCPLQLVSPVHLSEIYVSGGSPGSFYPSVDFQPFKVVKHRLPFNESAHIDVRIIGVMAGKWSFVIKLFFKAIMVRECTVTANILQRDGTGCQDIMAMPGIFPSMSSFGKTMTGAQAAARTKTLMDAQKKLSFVRCASQSLDERPVKSDVFRIAYVLPEKLLDLLSNTPKLRPLVELFPVLGQPVTFENYAEKFHVLLHLEEYQEQLGLRNFDLLSDQLSLVEGITYRLEVPNLQEHRPSLMIGDYVQAKGIDDPEGPAFEGRITQVGMESLAVVFSDSFESFFDDHKMLDISFFVNRRVYRLQHNILEKAKKTLSQRLLFPDVSNRDRCIERVKESLNEKDEIAWINESLNQRQRSAVRMIVAGKCRPLAHVIFGPPGTGKTTTVVEAVLQLHIRFPKSVILICTPSNSGVDLLGQKLIQSGIVSNISLRRVLGYQRKLEHVPAELSSCAQIGCEEPLTADHRIVLTTCQTAAVFAQAPHGFTHIIVDEAGFATEPELLPALTAADKRPDVQVVLAGDPHQLGPVVCSRAAGMLGLEKSLLSRLLELPAYCEWQTDAGGTEEFCPFLVSKLDVSYRAVESLLKISSKFFYNSELLTYVEDKDNVYAPRLGLPSLTFWPVLSMERRESRSPSVHNPGQVAVTVRLLRNLLTVGIEPHNIGIITPYRLQAEYIRKTLNEYGLPAPKIGTVDEFQGQERDAIIFSTVRARKSFGKDEDTNLLRSALGFVACPKRTNVALTRARYVMMIVGDPNILSLVEPAVSPMLKGREKAFAVLRQMYPPPIFLTKAPATSPVTQEIALCRPFIREESTEKHWRGILRYCVAKQYYQKDLFNENAYPLPAILARSTHRGSRKLPSETDGDPDKSCSTDEDSGESD